MNTTQPAIYGLKLLLQLLLGQTPSIDANSTVNERLGIDGALRPSTTEKVSLGILVVGNRGHSMTAGNGGIALTNVVDHYANHAALYEHLPFCLRPVAQDLDETKRARYALRKEITINGQIYYAYYGLRIKTAALAANVQMKLKVKNSPDAAFVPSTHDLVPEPEELPTSGAVTTSDVSLSVEAIVPVTLDADAIYEFVEAAKILHGGDERYAVISEFGLCTGADRMRTVNSTNGPINFLESIGTQIYAFSADHRPVYYNSQELSVDFDLGNQIPLLSTESISTLETIS